MLKPAPPVPEAGVNKGIVSGKNMGKAIYKKDSSKVKAEEKSYVHLTAMTQHDGSNTNMPEAAQIAPSQTKVIFSP